MADAAAVARNLLAKSALFARLDERNLGELAAYAQQRSFAVGELIFRFGDVGLSMLAIVAGTVRISLTAANGREIILADLERLTVQQAVPTDYVDLAEAAEFAPEVMDGECSA